MSVEDVVNLLGAANEIIKTLVWPFLFIFISFRYSKSLRDFFGNVNELSFKALGVEASAKRQQIKVASLLGAASSAKSEEGVISTASNSLIDTIVDSTTQKSSNVLSRSSVLWVDDNPSNNENERKALSELGIYFVIAKSTKEAIDYISERKFDAIISDMGRKNDQRAGYTLFNKLKKNSSDIPYIIYAGSNRAEDIEECKKNKCFGTTNQPEMLFNLVLSALLK